MDAEAAAVLGYVLSYVAGLVVVVGEEENEFVRFHVFQSVAYNVVVVAATVGFFVAGTVLLWVGTILVFLLFWVVILFGVAVEGTVLAGVATSGFSVLVTVFFVLLAVVAPLVTLVPVVALVPALAYLVYAAYRASEGDRYRMPYIGSFVEQYV